MFLSFLHTCYQLLAEYFSKLQPSESGVLNKENNLNMQDRVSWGAEVKNTAKDKCSTAVKHP